MKRGFALFIILFVLSVLNAQTTVEFPENEGVFTISVPNGWSSQYYEDHKLLEIVSPEGDFYTTVRDLDVLTLEEAEKEATDYLHWEFESAKLYEPQEEDINGITVYKYSGTELNIENDLLSFYIRLFRVDESSYFMIYYFGNPDDLEYYEFDTYEIDYSIEVLK